MGQGLRPSSPAQLASLHDAKLCKGNIEDSGHTSTYWHRVSWQLSH